MSERSRKLQSRCMMGLTRCDGAQGKSMGDVGRAVGESRPAREHLRRAVALRSDRERLAICWRGAA